MQFEKHLKSKTSRKIMGFFLENPASVDTPRGIAVWIGEKKGETKDALKGLVKAGMLVLHGEGRTSAYGCTIDTRIIFKIRAILEKHKKSKKK